MTPNSDSDGIILNRIKDLSVKERTILTLYYFEEWSYPEIAEMVHLTVEQVSDIHTKCLKKLKESVDIKP